MGTLLCVGLYPYDVTQLLVVAREAHQRLGLEPTFLDVSPPEVSAEVRDLVGAAGFQIVTTSLRAEGDWGARNWLDHLRLQQKATFQLMDDLLDDLEPAAIVAVLNPQPGYFLDRAAARGIPTVLVQLFHWGDRAFYRGLQADDRRQEDLGLSAFRRVKRSLKRRAQAHYGVGPYIAWDVPRATVAVQGPAMRQRLIADGAPSRNVVVTGNSALDQLYSLRASPEEARRRLRRQLRLPDDIRIITHMRSHEGRLVGVPPDLLRDTQAQIIHALRIASPEAQVIVKVHPKEDAAEKAIIRSIDPSVLVVGEDADTNDLLAASDLVVGTLSTTLLYAVLLDVPTVSVWLWPGLDYFRTSTEWSGVERVETPHALTEAVRRHLDDSQHRQVWRERRAAFIAEEFAFDGKSTDRVVELLARVSCDATPVPTATQR